MLEVSDPAEPAVNVSSLRKAAVLAALVTQLVFMVLAGLWIGTQADTRLGTDPIGLATGVFAGFGAGMWRLIQHVTPKPPVDEVV